jgi:chromosome segregation ATPase
MARKSKSVKNVPKPDTVVVVETESDVKLAAAEIAAQTAAETAVQTAAETVVAEIAAQTAADTAVAEVAAETVVAEIAAETAAETVAAEIAAETAAETVAAEIAAETVAAEIAAETAAETVAAEIAAETVAAEIAAETVVAEIAAETVAAEIAAETVATETKLEKLSNILKELSDIESSSDKIIRFSAKSQSEVDEIIADIAATIRTRNEMISDLEEKVRTADQYRRDQTSSETKNAENVKQITELRSVVSLKEAEYASMRAEIRQKESEIERLKSNIDSIEVSRKQIEEELRLKAKEVSDNQASIRSLDVKYQQSVGQVAKKSTELELQQEKEAKLEERIAAFQAKLDQYRVSEAENAGAGEAMKETISRIEEEKRVVTQSVAESAEEIKKLRAEIAQTKAAIEEKNIQLQSETATFKKAEKRLLLAHEAECAKLQAEIAANKTESEKSNSNLASINKRLAERDESIEEMKRRLEQLTAEATNAVDSGERTAASFVAEKNALTATIGELVSKNEMLALEKQSAERAIRAANAEAENKAAMLGELKDSFELEKQRLGNKVSGLVEEIKRGEQKRDTLQSLVDTGKTAMLAMEATIATQSKELSKTRQEYRDLQASTMEMAKTRAAMTDRIAVLTEEAAKMQKLIKSSQTEIMTALDQVKSLEKEMAIRDIAIEKLKSEREQLMATSSANNLQLVSLQETIRRLSAEDSSRAKQILALEDEIRKKTNELVAAKAVSDELRIVTEEKTATYAAQQETIAELIRSLEATNQTLKEKENQMMCSREGMVEQIREMTGLVAKHHSVLDDISKLTKVENEIKKELKTELGTRLNGFVTQIESVRESMCAKLNRTYDDEKLSLLSAFEGKMGLIQQRLGEIDMLEQDIKTRTQKFTYIDKFLQERGDIIKNQSEFIESQQAQLLAKREQVREVNEVFGEYQKLLENRATMKTILVDIKKRNDDHTTLTRELTTSNTEFEKLRTRVAKSNPDILQSRVDAAERTVGILTAVVGGQVALSVLRWMLFR